MKFTTAAIQFALLQLTTSVVAYQIQLPSALSPQRAGQVGAFATARSTAIWYAETGANDGTTAPSFVISPVLQQVYPALLAYKEEFGHPNIPLGSSEGRQCKTLRRLHIQDKLTQQEVEWLDGFGFSFNSLEDVYHDVEFTALMDRLLAYEASHPNNNFQIPKKCPEDPELGAWVTGIRRLGKEGVLPEHVQILDEAGFAWVSTRKCGSKFMQQYREILTEIETRGDTAAVLSKEKVRNWIRAQQLASQRGALSVARVHYLEELVEPVLEPGQEWTCFAN